MLLRSEAAVSLGRALHEVAANAARHGALSVPQGRVRLGWRIVDPDGPEARLVIEWREANGPPLNGPRPTGYGRELIEIELAQQIGATGSISVADGGLTAEIALPLSSGMVIPAGSSGDGNVSASPRTESTEEPN